MPKGESGESEVWGAVGKAMAGKTEANRKQFACLKPPFHPSHHPITIAPLHHPPAPTNHGPNTPFTGHQPLLGANTKGADRVWHHAEIGDSVKVALSPRHQLQFSSVAAANNFNVDSLKQFY